MAKHTGSYTIDDLLYLMSRLRDKDNGCPWDCQQNPVTLAPFALEEAYEVVDAIERNDLESLPEELGDLLFQVVFHAQLGSEAKRFDFSTIVSLLTSKLVSRHPHVFPDGTLHSRRDSAQAPENAEINAVWEQNKRQERTRKGHVGLLADIPLALPALVRAQKVQKRAATIGFDWRDPAGVLEKIREEIDELARELGEGDAIRLEDELGDVLFSVINMARHLGCDAETALRKSTRKFEQRFAIMERHVGEMQSLAELSDAELEQLWQKAKASPQN